MFSPADAWSVWVDGFGGISGSFVHALGTVADPCGDGGTVQTMQYIYDNDGTSPYGPPSPYYSEAVAETSNLVCGSDWTTDGVAFLQLSFKGKFGNDANERMYVVIEAGATPTPN